MRGRCLCGEIEFMANEVPGKAFNCHCTRCQRSHGAAYATLAFAFRSSIVFMRGRRHLREYAAPSGGVRAFCGVCGSRLMNYSDAGDGYASVAVACLDAPFLHAPVADACAGTMMPWLAAGTRIPSQAMPFDSPTSRSEPRRRRNSPKADGAFRYLRRQRDDETNL